MNWIDDRLNERRIKEKREQLVYSRADEVFDGLWGQIEQVVQEAKRKNIPAGIEGSGPDRVVYLSVLPTKGQIQGQRKELHLTLNKERTRINVRGAGTISHFDIEVGEDDIVGLTHDGAPIEYADAVELLLDRFLFWDLPMREIERTPRGLTVEEEEALRRIEHEGDDY